LRVCFFASFFRWLIIQISRIFKELFYYKLQYGMNF
jgi:hypothetical protein